MRKLNSLLLKLGLGLVVTALLLAGFAVARRPASAQLSAEPPATAQVAVVDTQDNRPQVPVQLPVFEPFPREITGIGRLAQIHTVIPDRPSSDVTTYTVKPGDNLFKIAEQFGLKPETVLWGNYETLRDNPQFLKPGQVLTILPVDGVYYQIPQGESLDHVASFFQVKPDDITSFYGNRLVSDLAEPAPSVVEPGTWLVIPGGRRELKDWGPPAISRTNPAAAAYYGAGSCGTIYEGAIGTGGFIWPTVAKYLSGYDYNPAIHPGLDIAGAEGNAIFAVDSGVVVFAGWSAFGYGYLVVLDHGTGWQSAYAHMSAVSVSCGESVAQGKVIGAVGNTGNSTGPHLHFELRSEVYGKVNPWEFLTY